MVSDQSLLESIGVIVRALDQCFASDVVLHFCLGRVEDLVIRSARGWVHESPRYPGNEKAIIDLELDGVEEFLVSDGQHVV